MCIYQSGAFWSFASQRVCPFPSVGVPKMYYMLNAYKFHLNYACLDSYSVIMGVCLLVFVAIVPISRLNSVLRWKFCRTPKPIVVCIRISKQCFVLLFSSLLFSYQTTIKKQLKHFYKQRLPFDAEAKAETKCELEPNFPSRARQHVFPFEAKRKENAKAEINPVTLNEMLW